MSSAPRRPPASLHGTDIRRILTEAGPVVQCVLLRHMAASGRDEHPSPWVAPDAEETDHSSSPHGTTRPVLAHLVEQRELDTTPSKRMVQQVLQGPWTFLGQYEEEGTVVMVRQPLPGLLDEDDDKDDDDDDENHDGSENDLDPLQHLSVEELETLCREYYIPLPDQNQEEEEEDQNHDQEEKEHEQEKEDHNQEKEDHKQKPSQKPSVSSSTRYHDRLVQTLAAARDDMARQVNPHRLQPPLDHATVYGDMLLLRVAPTNECWDNDEDQNEENEPQDMAVMSNHDFFLDYTKDEYLAFASRTDVVAPEPPEDEEDDDEEENEEEEEDDDDEAYELGEDDDDEEAERQGLLNLLMAECLRQFREEHGRGPNTEELLAMRQAVADKLGVHVASVPMDQGTEDRKRTSEQSQVKDQDASAVPTKRVKFSAPPPEEQDEPEHNDDEATEG